MKFDFKKLNTDAPGQHVAIVAMSGVFIFLTVVEWIKGPSEGDFNINEPQGSFSETGIPRYKNPEMAWYERWFCRGYQRSSICSWRLLHPLTEAYEQHGIKIQQKPPVKNGISPDKDVKFIFRTTPSDEDPNRDPMSARGVVIKRNYLPKNRAFTSRIKIGD